jgi:hypothetical protein
MISMRSSTRWILLASALVTVVAVTAGAGFAGSARHTTTSTTVFIPATVPFTDTGVALSAGQTVSITMTGHAVWCCHPAKTVSAAGIAFPIAPCPVSQYPPSDPFTAPGLACFSAIGQIGGTSIIFQVGKSLTMTTPVGGELMLGFNDNFYGDNRRGFTATITVS